MYMIVPFSTRLTEALREHLLTPPLLRRIGHSIVMSAQPAQICGVCSQSGNAHTLQDRAANSAVHVQMTGA